MIAPDLTITTAVGGALTAAVTYLFKLVQRQSLKLTVISEQLGEYRGRQEGIAAMSAEVLAEIKKLKA